MSSVHASTIAHPDPNEFNADQRQSQARHQRRLHKFGCQAHSDGKVSSSAQLLLPKAIRLIYELTAQLKDKAAYAG